MSHEAGDMVTGLRSDDWAVGRSSSQMGGRRSLARIPQAVWNSVVMPRILVSRAPEVFHTLIASETDCGLRHKTTGVLFCLLAIKATLERAWPEQIRQIPVITKPYSLAMSKYSSIFSRIA